MTTLIQSWGRPVPKEMTGKIAATWGARAIYTGQQIDLLHDRQSWNVTGFSSEDADESSPRYKARRAGMRPLMDWVNTKGLPFLRKEAKRLSTDESRVVSLDDGAFHIEASPQASYGYLYIRAWELKLTKPEAAALKKGGGSITTATAARLLGTDASEVEACLKLAKTRRVRK